MYTGIQALRTTYGTMGFFPKILIAPGYSQVIGSSTLKTANGDRPSNPPVADAITIEQTNGDARIQIKNDGSILIEGATIDIHSRGELKLRGSEVKVE